MNFFTVKFIVYNTKGYHALVEYLFGRPGLLIASDLIRSKLKCDEKLKFQLQWKFTSNIRNMGKLQCLRLLFSGFSERQHCARISVKIKCGVRLRAVGLFSSDLWRERKCIIMQIRWKKRGEIEEREGKIARALKTLGKERDCLCNTWLCRHKSKKDTFNDAKLI